MKTKVAVVSVPFILSKPQFELAKLSLLSLSANAHPFDLRIITVVNRFDGKEEDKNWLKNISNDYIENDKNILALAWNRGIKIALELGAEYVLVINLDIFFEENFLANLISFAQKNPQHILWGGHDKSLSSQFDPDAESTAAMVHYSCFLCDSRLFEEIGEFDEAFAPAYHEDNDMGYRIALAGHTIMSTSSARYDHTDRGTLKGAVEAGDYDYVMDINKYLDDSLDYYKRKWGGSPGKETFTTPFGK